MVTSLLYEDDFNTFDLTKYLTRWFYTSPTEPGCSLPSNGELELYINADGPLTIKPWTTKNSVLSLTCMKDPIQGYTSGMINTYGHFQQQYGYFEIRAKLPLGNGLWPAFWLVPSDGSWPPELDILEFLGRDPMHENLGTHSGVGGPNVGQGGSYLLPFDPTVDFHTYGADWQTDTVKFYLDGNLVTSMPTPVDMNKPMYIILNLALGGPWAGPVDDSKLPASFDIDYLRVYNERPDNSMKYDVVTPWANVHPTTWTSGTDTLSLNFNYDDLSIIHSDTFTSIWAKTGDTWTLAARVPCRISVLG